MSASLTDAQRADYARDGFVVIRGFFSEHELAPLLAAYRCDPTVNGALYGMQDEQGLPHPICIWTELGDDMIGMIPRMERMIDATEFLLHDSCYHWHSKLTVKPQGCQARIDWHQDYYSWYDDGVPFPNLLTVGIAIEPATLANGCLQVIPGSHHLGRLEARDYASFEQRIEHAKQNLGLHYCEMDTGDAVFFHSNTLHGSDDNQTDSSRLMLFASYNAKSNQPIPGAQGENVDGYFMNIQPEERRYKIIHRLADTVLTEQRFKSAFDHTPFKRPVTRLTGTFQNAVQL